MLYDKDIREPLFLFLEEIYGKIRILEEKRIAGSRSDVTMITGSNFIGIEIKSDADTYSRLSTQVKNYDRFFDKNILVIGTSHAHHAEEHVPDYWGIITVEEVDGEIDFYVLREPKENPKMEIKDKITVLWRPELNNILEKNNLPGYKYLSKKKVQEKILEKVPAEILQTQMSEELFERDYNAIKDQINAYRESVGRGKRRRRYKYKIK